MKELTEIEIDLIDTVEKFASLEDDWNRLVAIAKGMTVFQTFDWNHCWWSAYGSDHELLILKMKSGGAIIGIAPLMITNGTIEFIGTPNADYSDFISSDPEICIEAVAGFMKKKTALWSRIALTQIPETSQSLPILKRVLEKSGMSYRLLPIENVMAYRYEGGESGRTDFELHKGGTIRKFMNYFNKLDGLSLVCFDSPGKILERLPEFYHSHIIWWFRRGGDGCKFLNPKVRLFHDLAAKNMAEDGRARLYMLMHGQQPLAYLYAFIHDKIIHLYQIASLMNYRKKSPGILLLHMLVEQAVREGFDVIDFSRGAGEHKERFANQTGRNMLCAVYSSGFQRLLAAVYAALKNSGAGHKLKNLGIVRKIKNSLTKTGRGNYYQALDKTTNVIFAGKEGRMEFEFYYGEKRIFEKPMSRKKLEFREMTSKDLTKIAAFIGIENDSREYSEYARRFANEDRCFMGYIEDSPAAAGWVLGNTLKLPKHVYELLKDNEAGYVAEVGISPVFDSLEIAESFYRFMGSVCGEAGKSTLIACKAADRELAAILKKIGFRRLRS
jgi:CelD/BcsL family acetyltransferase involved in cellulose biosynthesis